MPNIDKDWVINQLLSVTTPPKTGDAIVHLLKAWSEIDEKLPVDVQKDAVAKFSKLALGHPLIDSVNENEKLIPAMAGRLKVGDEVIVRFDAFDGELGQMHNGRRGRVVAVRYGDIIVNSIDGVEPELNGSHYSPSHLLKVVKE
jgi:hypothetical protein